MTTVTKVTAAPYSTTAYTNTLLTATTTATATFTPTTLFSIVKKFDLWVVGQSGADLEPTKSMTKWFSDTASSRKTNSVDVASNVSSFAIVVDVTTKALLAATSMYCGTAGSIKSVNTDADPNTCALGYVGNNFGFFIQNGTLTTTTLAAYRVS